jgi:hypothetical protein
VHWQSDALTTRIDLIRDLAQCSKILYLEVVCVAPEDGELRHELAVDPPAELYEWRLLASDGGVAPCTPCGSQPHLQQKPVLQQKG